jgi:hypothetical protein
MSVLTRVPERTNRQTTSRLLLAELIGLVVVPVLITVAVNSWSSPGSADYIRMAFGTVASSVIASMVAIAVAIVARLSVPGTTATLFVVVAVIVSLWAFGRIVSAASELDAVLGRL